MTWSLFQVPQAGVTSPKNWPQVSGCPELGQTPPRRLRPGGRIRAKRTESGISTGDMAITGRPRSVLAAGGQASYMASLLPCTSSLGWERGQAVYRGRRGAVPGRAAEFPSHVLRRQACAQAAVPGFAWHLSLENLACHLLPHLSGLGNERWG